jgi:hypothetical protein
MIDLQRFCANESDPRPHLRAPFKRGSWVYATNGHVCVRVPAATMPSVTECDKAPPAHNLFKKHIEDRACEFLVMPPLKAHRICSACYGKGFVFASKCPSCTDGMFDHYGMTYDCLYCDDSKAGPGWVDTEDESATRRPCDSCDGLGADMRENGNVRLGESTYSLVYLNWLAKLPQVRVCPGSPADAPSADQIPAVFIFDGGHAILMPRRD